MSRNKSYLEQIDELIIYHRAELERLEIARQVIASLANSNNTQKTTAEEPAADTAITIRRTTPKPTAAPAKATKADKPKAAKGVPAPARTEDKAALKEKVLSELAVSPRKSGDLIEKFAPPNPDKAEKQFVYALLYDLKRTGVVTRDEESLYRLAQTSH